MEHSASGLYAEGTGCRACLEARGGFGSLCEPAIGGISGAHYFSIFSFIQQERAFEISDFMEASVREVSSVP